VQDSKLRKNAWKNELLLIWAGFFGKRFGCVRLVVGYISENFVD